MDAAPAVSVLVPILNEEEHLEDSLALMRGQDPPGGLEILAVDGGSTDRTPEILARVAAEDPRVRVLANPARLIPNALNIGLRAARGEYVARMDAHTWYPADYLARGIERLGRGDVAWVSGPQLAEGRGRWSRRVALALSTPMGFGGASFRYAQEEIEVDSGFTGVWRRETLIQHGGWDEGWPINEDGELAARIRAAGGRIVCVPEMAARYVPRDSLRGLARQYWRYGQYRAKTARHRPGGMRRSHVLPPGLVLAAVAGVLPGPQRRAARAGVAAWACGLAATAARAAARGAPARDAAALPAVLATMHVAWGAGFLLGCARFGPPVAALARLARGAR
ncbi:MAG TPA: glycosyltransferase family 2 protein [Solirubrobacteraceae bacterium]|nr:glycosyltransferase family 2 protein [Solirubrobacteraceae bacterium]